jgi:chloride channel protein, CIC family
MRGFYIRLKKISKSNFKRLLLQPVMIYQKILGRFLIWRAKHIKHHHFILILSAIVGLCGGLAAVALKNLVHYVGFILTDHFKPEDGNYLYFAYPFIGLVLTFLYVKYFVKDNIGHGISRILFSISKNNSLLRSHNMYSSMFASTMTIGFGGSVGTEAPIVLTGASIGSSLGRLMHLNYKYRTLLIGCGATAAIAGIFKAPIAAVVFTLEVLMLDLTTLSIVPLLISAVVAVTVSSFLLGEGALFSFSVSEPFVLNHLPFYLLLGIVTGLVSLYFTKASMYIENKIEVIKKPLTRLLIGGITLGLLIYLFPPLYGEGYNALKVLQSNLPESLTKSSLFYSLRDNQFYFIIFLILILIMKVIAMSTTTGSDGVGGIFAPALFMGGTTGFLVARIINIFYTVRVSESNFSLVGMAGVMAGVLHAPLTAIFLIAEITGGYKLFLPIMLTCTVSYLTIKYFETHSIYTKRLAKRGELITHHKDKAVLTLMKIRHVIENNFRCIHPDSTLGELVKVISESKRNIFPVTGNDNKLVGLIYLDDVRKIIFDPHFYDKKQVKDFMVKPLAIINWSDTMEQVMEKFEMTKAWNLPVTDNGKYMGFISKSKIFNTYREMMIQFSDE